MGYIHSIQLNDNSVYLIEPILYAAASGTATTLTANINNFELVIGTNVNIKVGTVDANATLNVSNTGAKEIHYNNEKVTANQLKANHIYTFVYDGTYWQVVGDFDTDTWRDVENSLTSDSTTISLSAAQGKVLKGLIDAMDASTPAASGNATAFIDSITQTDGKITSITKKTIPAASTSIAGIVKIGTTANDAAAGNHNHDSTYSYIHLTDYDFTDTQPLSKYVTFDKSRPVGAPKEEWYNGFISSHNNYHASYIINGHTNQNEWYVGHGIWREANTPHAPAPTWYLLAHSGNVGTGDNNGQVKIAGQNVSVKGLKALAYKDSLVASDIPNLSWSKITSDKPTTLSGYGITDAASSSHSHTLKIGNKSLSVGTSEQEWNVHDILYNENIIYQSTSWDIITPGIYAVTNSSHDGSGHPGSTSGQTAPYSYGHLIVTRAGSNGAAQIYISHVASGSKAANKGIRYRSGWNVNNTDKTEAERWQAWATILDDKNFNLYAPTLTGTGASGTWGISITGNAATASAVAWENTGHPSTFPPSAHTHYELATIGDKRSEDTTPDTYKNRIIFQGLKQNSTIGSPHTDMYSYLVGLRGWSDSSGGNSHELAFNGNGIYRRQGATDTWGNWYQILDSNNTTAGANNTATLAWNTTYTIAKINDVDIKFTTMAKPSYAFTDLTEHPTTLSGYGITDANITSGIITLGSNTITPVTSVNGHTGSSVNVTAADLGLSNALHFIGVTSTTLADKSTTATLTPKSTGSLSKTTGFVDGDVVMDSDQLREYVWSGDAWRLLGITTSTAYIQPTSTATNTWIAQISQGTDGKITATTGSLDTSGLWSGNAATAIQFAAEQKIYVDLTTRFHEPTAANPQDQITKIQGGKNTAEIIGIDGILEVRSGGTGTDSFAPNQVILSTNPSEGQAVTFTSRPYSNSVNAEALSISTNFVTEQDVYYGLPKINNLHNYTSNNNIFAPITGGLQYQILVSSSNTTAPLWATHAFVNSAESAVSNQQAFTTLTLGNNVAVSSEIAHSEGRIELYSTATSSHIIKGDSTTTQHTHILPNSDGHIAQVPSAVAVGSPTQPVFVAANGVITPLTYVPNRLYYSIAAATPATESSDSFTATIHYADNSHIGLGASNWPENCTDTLYVTGTTSFNGNVYHKSNVYFGDATNYYIDATATGYLPDLRVDKIQLDENYINFYSHVNANNTEQEDENQSRLLLGYIQGTNTGMLFHRCTLGDNGASATDPQNLLSQYPIFKFNGHLLPEETDTNDLGANLFRWKDAYFQGNIYMQNVSTPRLGQTNTANKIIWKSAYHDAEIYFSASQSDEAGKLVFHSKPQVSNTNGRLHSTIAIAFDDNDTAYINYSDPSFYPAVNNSGYLGLSTNRWNKVYIGDNDIYGDDYTPIYWNDGAPKVVAPVQQYTFTINANTNGVTITHEAFTTDTYVLQIVITYGMENLNAPLTWNSYDPQGNQLGGIQLQCSALTSGLIQGYVITSRGKTYDVSNNMTNYFTPINP